MVLRVLVLFGIRGMCVVCCLLVRMWFCGRGSGGSVICIRFFLVIGLLIVILFVFRCIVSCSVGCCVIVGC